VSAARCIPSPALVSTALAAVGLVAAGCGAHARGVCATAARGLPPSSFVFVERPRSGEIVPSGFTVSGCSSTYEGTVDWSLRGRDGRLLATGVAQGGSLASRPFRFAIRYSIRLRQIGQLELDTPSVTREGFPPLRNVLPVILEPKPGR
jgi:hypothetical protein